MKHTLKKLLFVGIAILLLPALMFAQSATGGSSRGAATYTLTVTCNAPNATVQISGAGAAKLGSSGQAPFSQQLAPGTYAVTVTAPGFNSKTQNVNLTGNMTINVQLAPANFSLNVTSNVPGTRIRIQGGSGTNINGNTDMSVQLPPGNYQVAAVAQGYQPQVQQVVLNGNQTVSFMLMPSMAKVTIILSQNILNPRVGNPAAQVKVYDNGQPVNGMAFDLNPGQHTIRVESGGFSFETTLQLVAGQEYRIEPYGGLMINGQKM